MNTSSAATSSSNVVIVTSNKTNHDFRARVKYEHVVIPILVAYTPSKKITFADGSSANIPEVIIYHKRVTDSLAVAQEEKFLLSAGNENRLRALCHLAGVKSYPADLLQHPGARDYFVSKLVEILNQPKEKGGILDKPHLLMLFPKGAAAFKFNKSGVPPLGTPCSSVLLTSRSYKVTKTQMAELREFYANGEAEVTLTFYDKPVTFRRSGNQIINKHDLPCKFDEMIDVVAEPAPETVPFN